MTRTAGRPRRSLLTGVQRQLQLIVLAHIWALAPLAGAWFLVPAWRGRLAPPANLLLDAIAAAAGFYLIVRTLLTLSARAGALAFLWPYIDTVLISVALIAVGSPTDAVSYLYFIPIASGVALLNGPHLIALATAIAAAYTAVIVSFRTPWSIDILFRVVVIVLFASLYGRVIRLVTMYARMVERAEYQAELASEMHDGIQHLLVTLSARLELAARLIAESPGRAGAIVAAECQTARRAADELRYLVRRGRFTPDDAGRREARDGGVAATLRAQLAATADRWPFALTLELPHALPHVPPAIELALLRVIQESLTNAAKHAAASSVDVTLAETDGRLTCTIRDNGVGFDPASTVEQGLSGLRERVRALGGSLTVSSSAGGGTTVAATFPLARRERWLQFVS
jgi:signal transduction histidine kinase